MGDDDGELEEDARLLDELTAPSCRVAGRAPRLRRLLRGRIREGGAGEAVADLKVLAAAVEGLMEVAEDEKKEQGKAAAAPVGVVCVGWSTAMDPTDSQLTRRHVRQSPSINRRPSPR